MWWVVGVLDARLFIRTNEDKVHARLMRRSMTWPTSPMPVSLTFVFRYGHRQMLCANFRCGHIPLIVSLFDIMAPLYNSISALFAKNLSSNREIPPSEEPQCYITYRYLNRLYHIIKEDP
jgi:hypothetical protein